MSAGVLTAADRKPVDRTLIATIGGHEQDVSFASRQHLALKGWFFQPDAPSGRSVMRVPGWRQNRVDPGYGTELVAHDLLAHGYAVLLFDLSASGESAGDHFTWHERVPGRGRRLRLPHQRGRRPGV